MHAALLCYTGKTSSLFGRTLRCALCVTKVKPISGIDVCYQGQAYKWYRRQVMYNTKKLESNKTFLANC